MIGATDFNRNVRDVIDSRVLPDLKRKSLALEGYAQTQGIVFGYPDYSGWRSLADTTQLIKWRDEAVAENGAKAYYPVAPYGVGYHGKGAAFDIKVVKVPAGKTIAWGYATLGAFAPKIGLTWGGTFAGKANDIFHFQLAIPLAVAAKMFADYQTATSHPNVRTSVAPPPKAGTAPLAASVRAISTPTGAASLGVVAILALVAVGFFLSGVAHEHVAFSGVSYGGESCTLSFVQRITAVSSPLR